MVRIKSFCLLMVVMGFVSTQLDAQYTYTGSGNWGTATNWSHSTNNGEVPGTNLDEQAVINGGSTVTLDSNQPSIRALRLEGGAGTATLNILSGADINITTSSPWDSSIGRAGASGVVNQSGGNISINYLELGRDNGVMGKYFLSGGSLNLSRGGNSNTGGSSLIMGTNDSSSAGGTGDGLLEITGGTLTTRAGIWLGGTAGTASAVFSVLGSGAAEVGIGTSNTGTDGNLTLNNGATIKVGIDFSGVTKILVDDHGNGNNFATFESGSLLDVDYYSGFSGGGTWTVLELENGDITDNGLAFASGVDTNVWSFAIDNSGANGLLTVTSSDPVLRDAYWDGSESAVWEEPLNWTNNYGAFDESYVHIDFGTVDYTAASDTGINLRGFRMTAGTLNISGGNLRATQLSSAYSHLDGTVNQTGGTTEINALELGRGTSSNAHYILSNGELKINRGKNGYSLYLGSNSSSTDSGSGTLTISGGKLTTRTGVKLGDATDTGTGKFVVLGTDASEIIVAGANDDQDGYWEQYSGSTLEVGVDFGGVTPIYLADSDTDTSGTSATFETGSLLDVDYHNITEGGGTWVVMEVENGDIIDNGLSFASGVDTSIWSFAIDNSGANGRLLLTAVGNPLGYAVTIGNTLQQKMRYGMDFERLWFWTGGLNGSERDDVARWSAVDTDIDFVRVAMNSDYELTEGTYNLSAYTNKIIPLMQEMQEANPNIKFFASPRPLNEAVSGASWQPYPLWVTGATTYTSGDYDFNDIKCAEYIVRYLLLMKSYGFQISFLDVTNEWQSNVGGGRLTQDDMDDIEEYLNVTYFNSPWSYSGVGNTLFLDPEDIPEIIAPSSWNYSQGGQWIDNLDTGDKAAISIAASHNTDRTGSAVSFANSVYNKWNQPGDTIPEIWNTEVHGWKSTSSANETTTFRYYLETIRAGFGGINGWLAIGTTNQGHSYILNPSGTPTRNVKYYIFQKLSSTSNYGHALNILDEPSASTFTDTSDDYDSARNVAAFIKGNLMTVWIINEHPTSVPVVITPSSRTIAESNVRLTRWTGPSDVEGFVSYLPVTSNTSVASTIPGESVCCFEIVLDTEDFSNDRIEAEDFSHQWGVGTETTGDVDGVENICHTNNGDWLRFGAVALTENSELSFRVARPSAQPNSKIQIREGSADGAMLGEVSVPVTGRWQSYQTISTSLNVDAGIYNLYLVFVEDSVSPTGGYLVNFNWFAVNESVAVPITGLSAMPAGDTQIDLAWDSASGAATYDVRRASTSGGPYTTIATNISGTSYSDAGLIPDTTYYYVVNGNFDGLDGPDSSEAVATTGAEAIVPENLVIGSFVSGYDSFNNEQLTFTVEQTGLGQYYQVHASETLELNEWTPIGPIYSGTGGQLLIDVLFDYSSPAYEEHFFRLEVWVE